MDIEVISKIKILPTGELILLLQSGGKPMYQYIYRSAAGVHWDQDLRGFKSTQPKVWSYSEWFGHICGIVKSELGINLKLTKETSWANVPAADKENIEAQNFP